MAQATEKAHELARAAGGTVRHQYSRVFKGFSVTIDNPAAVTRLAQNPNVLYVEPVLSLPTHSGQQSNPGWALDRIDSRALSLNSNYRYEHTGAGVHIYIIDSGIDASHADFAGRVGNGHAEEILGCPQNPYTDANGHGTAVAAVAAGTTYGVAKGATIHPVQLVKCYERAGDSDEVIGGIDWVASNRILPAVANFSLSGNGWYPLMGSVADALTGMYNAGVVVVKSAGNDNVDACTDNGVIANGVIAVGASNAADGRHPQTNWGPCIDIFAPGQQVSTITQGLLDPTGFADGTSIAAGFVSGTAALVLDDSPGLNPLGVWGRILYGSTYNPPLSGLNGGEPTVERTIQVTFDVPLCPE